MSCFNGLQSQIETFLSVPHEILLLQHKVFREYAKVAVGPEFVHTLPSFLIITAMVLIFWRNPPLSRWLTDIFGAAQLYKLCQVLISWISINAVLWLWLVFQRVLYCSVWKYRSYENEYHDISFTWWHRVWSSYYPPPIQSPVLSSDLISWIISMLLATIILGCAISPNPIYTILKELVEGIRDTLSIAVSYTKWSSKRLQEIVSTNEIGVSAESSEISSVCDECGSLISAEAMNRSMADDWTPKLNFLNSKGPHRKTSMKSIHTVAGIINDGKQDSDKYSPRQLRHRRGCHTAIPSNSSDKSSKSSRC